MGAFSFSDNDDSNTRHAGIFTGTSDPQMSAWDIEFGIQRERAVVQSRQARRNVGELSEPPLRGRLFFQLKRLRVDVALPPQGSSGFQESSSLAEC
jgi:hypothetical protein